MNNVQSTLVELRRFEPTNTFKAQANITAEKLQALYDKAEVDYEGFWGDLACEELTWNTPFTQTLDSSNTPYFSWFSDGKINVSANCIDRHLATRGDQTAIIFENEAGESTTYTFKELHRAVSRFANVLKAQNVQKGDRVIIYMPMTAHAVFAMQACARIGATHSVVFGGFSSEALKDRIIDAEAKVIVTADGSLRGGRPVLLKNTVDAAISDGADCVETVIVLKNYGNDVDMVASRDIWWHEAENGVSDDCAPVPVAADHPLFVLYTSGSTGKPKGVQHSSAGYLLNTIITMKWVMDIKPDSDVFWCTADVGWITGHSYVCYGPLACGATIMIYEGGPMVPDAGRFWKICQERNVSIFYTAPTAIRALMKAGDAFPQKYDLSKIRLLGTVGEPINPEAWMWYHRVIGNEQCPIVDTWWQTETGANMIAPIPGVVATKPGSCTRPLPGIAMAVVDETGEPIQEPNSGGALVITKPWPSMLRTVFNNDERYVDAYWSLFNNRYYVAGDNARFDEDGYFWIMGRMDDVLNVSGHRLGTMEIESALVSHDRIAEAAVIGRPHDVKGESVLAFVIPIGDRPQGDGAEQLAKELRDVITKEIGALAKPDEIRFVDNLPKTRSGKIMRRLLKVIGKGEEVTQDTSSLENPDILKQMQDSGY